MLTTEAIRFRAHTYSPPAQLAQVPYPPAGVLPHLFFGEEVWMLARMWTRGWRVFAPSVPIVFHQWERSVRAHAFQTVSEGYPWIHSPTRFIVCPSSLPPALSRMASSTMPVVGRVSSRC